MLRSKLKEIKEINELNQFKCIPKTLSYNWEQKWEKWTERNMSNNWTKYIVKSEILCTLSYKHVKSLFLGMLSDKLSSDNFSISDIAAYDS